MPYVTSVIEFLAWAWPTIRSACKVIISLGGLVAVILSILLSFADVSGGLDALALKIDALSATLQGLPTHDILDKVNRVFPLSEYFGLILAHLSLLVACMLVRWLKAVVLFWSGG